MNITDATKEILSSWLSIMKLDAIVREKSDAVKVQDFPRAAMLREKEVEERKKVLSYDRLCELSAALNAQDLTGGKEG